MAVAASGGTDSTALLHCVCRLAARYGLHVHALHVNHGLQPEADDWVSQLRRQLATWARHGLPVTLHVQRLSGRPAAGDSIEAWARRERRAALASMTRDAGCDLLLVAHHRGDQAETVLLQALRGGGARGLAAMPQMALLGGLTWARPWLDQPKSAIETYLRRHRLRVVHDPSNSAPRFDRSRLRQEVMPALARAFPDAEVALGAAARRAAIESEAIRDWLSRDLPGVLDSGRLAVAAWLTKPAAQRQLLLRRWLEELGVARVPDSLIARLAQEVPHATVGRWPLSADAAELALHRGRLRLRPLGQPEQVTPVPCRVDLSRPGRHGAPGWRGHFTVRSVDGGLTPEDLRRAVLWPRRGGERFQAGPGRPPRSLKKQFQERGIAADERRAPLVYIDDSLVFVPGLGVDARWRGRARVSGTAGLELQWHAGTTPEGRADAASG